MANAAYSAAIVAAITAVFEGSDLRTPDLGGTAGTTDMTIAIRGELVDGTKNKTVS